MAETAVMAIQITPPGVRASRSWPFGSSLAVRLVGLVMLAVLVSGGLVGTLLVAHSRDALQAEVLHSNLNTAGLAASFAAQFVASEQLGLRDLAGRAGIVEALEAGFPERTESDLVWYLHSHPHLDDVAIADAEGIVRVSGLVTNPRIGQSVAGRDWFEQPLATDLSLLGLPRASAATGNATLPYGVPILDQGGTVRGVLVGGIALHELSAAIAGTQGRPGGRVALIDSREGGILLAHPDPKRILERSADENEAARRFRAGERGAKEVTGGSGERTLAAFAPVPDLPWSVLVQEPSQVAFAPVRVAVLGAVAVSGLALFFLTTAGMALAVQLIRPLLRLRGAADALSHGDFGAQLPAGGSDEVGQLAAAFARMRTDLARLLDRHKQAQEAELERRRLDGALLVARTVAHELNNTLGPVIGYAELLAEAPAVARDPKLARSLKAIYDSAVHAGETVRRLQRIIRLEEAPSILGAGQPVLDLVRSTTPPGAASGAES